MSSDHKNTNSGFKVPTDYFAGLTDRVLDNLKNPEVKETGFTVPENYLDTLTDTIITSVNDSRDEIRVIPLKAKAEPQKAPSWLVPFISIAAMGILLFSLQSLWETNEDGITALGDEEMMNYVMNLEDGMDQEAVDLLFLDNDILDGITIDTKIQDDQLLDYLIDEVDLNQIYTE